MLESNVLCRERSNFARTAECEDSFWVGPGAVGAVGSPRNPGVRRKGGFQGLLAGSSFQSPAALGGP